MDEYIMPFLSSIGTLLLIVAIFVGAYYVSKVVGRRYQSFGSENSGNIEILEKKPLGKEQSLIVAKVAGKTMLLGVTSHSIQKIEELDPAQIIVDKTAKTISPDFMGVFKDILKKKNGEIQNQKNRAKEEGKVNRNEKL